jgi:anti-sigma factor ChrR (cupin superfamily)
MIRHHPSGDLLASYAAGGLNVGMALVVGSHVDICAACRSEISLLNGVGGVLLTKLEPVSLSEGALERALKRLDEDRAPPRALAQLPRFLNGFEIPQRLQSQQIGAKLWLAPGIWFAPINAEHAPIWSMARRTRPCRNTPIRAVSSPSCCTALTPTSLAILPPAISRMPTIRFHMHRSSAPTENASVSSVRTAR